MTDAVVESVLLRGPLAARLARIAATELPRALEASLAGMADSSVGILEVPLGPELAELDDATIAVIWARAVRAELERQVPAGGAAAGQGAAARVAEAMAAQPIVTMADAVAEARAWLALGVPRGPVPRAALVLARWIMATEISGAIGGSSITNTLEALAVQLVRAIDHEAAHAHSEGTNPAPASAAPPVTQPARPPAPPQPEAAHATAATPPRDRPFSAATPQPAEVQAAVARLAALGELMGGAAHLDPAATTRAAGLALLYPWLSDVCRAAMALHPGLDEAHVRAHALAALVDPHDLSLAEDPLVRLLAGVVGPAAAALAPLPHAAAVAHEADRALAGFASLVPGFAQSSPDFVRREWIVRAGVLDLDADPVRLTAATHPLDVVLSRLPYPLGLFKLPWAPPVTVRFQP